MDRSYQWWTGIPYGRAFGEDLGVIGHETGCSGLLPLWQEHQMKGFSGEWE
jgi:hypothetical protein